MKHIITDTHTHLYSEAFNDDRAAVIERAMQVGVQRFFLPAIDSSYAKAMVNLQSQYPKQMFLMSGLHPCSVKAGFEKELTFVRNFAKRFAVKAIGEIGIDLYWDRTFLAEQQEAFAWQIMFAKEEGLPIVIHCRDAFEEVFEVLEKYKDNDLFGIFHCFTGSFSDAQRAIDYGLKLGIGGVSTYKNGKIDSFLANIPLEYIVLETDAPYLSPTPHRGKRNEPAFLVEVVKKLSSIYSLSEEEIIQTTTQNSVAVFGV